MTQSQSAQVIGVLGAGSWGTALAILLARNGHRVLLWGNDPQKVQRMSLARRNRRYLPETPFPESLEPCADLEVLLQQTQDLLVVVPSEAFRLFIRELKPRLQPLARMLWATKGLETSTGKFLHQIVAEEWGEAWPHGILSGPSFAQEVARGLPTAVTLASSYTQFANDAVGWFHSEAFRVYTSEDIIGVELGGALKNVLAIASGVSDGLGFGANARAAIVTRGLAEIMRLGDCVGAQRETLMGLSGVGDLVLTCTDDLSRNRRLGIALGRGELYEDAMQGIGQVVEGAKTAKAVMRLAKEHGVDMPICQQVYRILYEGHSPEAAVSDLLGRDLKPE